MEVSIAMKLSQVIAVVMAVAVLVLGSPSRVHAQGGNVPAAAQGAADDAADVARRFRLGAEAGVGLDPELIMFGGHGSFGPIFTPRVNFRPGVEFGLGEVTTLFGINFDVLYTFPGGAGRGRWAPYVGAGPNFTLSHKGFDTDETDKVDTGTTTTTTGTTSTDTPSRFDFSDTDFSSGFNFIAGARRGGMFFEMKATAYGVSNIRLLAGFNF
jgi:hypothetical protein